MKLYFDTSDNQKTTVRMDDLEIISPTTINRSQQLLPLIQRMLKDYGKTVKDISEIEFNPGPGSYTGLKVGAAIANTLGLVLNIPVNGQDVLKVGPVEPKYE